MYRRMEKSCRILSMDTDYIEDFVAAGHKGQEIGHQLIGQ